MNLWFRYWQCLKKMWRIKWYFSIFFSIILLHVRKIGRSMASIEDFKWMSNKSKKAENLLNTTKWGFLCVRKSRRAVLFSIFTCFNNSNEIISFKKNLFSRARRTFSKNLYLLWWAFPKNKMDFSAQSRNKFRNISSKTYLLFQKTPWDRFDT